MLGNIITMSRMFAAAKFSNNKLLIKLFVLISIFKYKPCIFWIVVHTSDIFNLVSGSKQIILEIRSVALSTQVAPVIPRFGIRTGRPILSTDFIQSAINTSRTAIMNTNSVPNGFMLWFVLFNKHVVSVRTFGVMYDHTLSKLANHQIIHKATNKVGCQPGDFLRGLCG